MNCCAPPGCPSQPPHVGASLIWDRYGERLKALRLKPEASKPWWKAGNNGYENFTREQSAEWRNVQREASNEVTRVVGPDHENSGLWQDPRLTVLDSEKRKIVQEIREDYQDLIQEVRRVRQCFPLPGEDEKIKFPMEEQIREYQTLIAATDRLSLPSETARQVFDLRTTVSSESVRIIDSPDLGVEQKKQTLAALAQTTRSQIRSRIGKAAADSYMKNNTDWLTKVETGNAVTFDEEGTWLRRVAGWRSVFGGSLALVKTAPVEAEACAEECGLGSEKLTCAKATGSQIAFKLPATLFDAGAVV